VEVHARIERAVAIAPDCPEAASARAQWLRQAGDLQGATDWARRAVYALPSARAPRFFLIDCLLLLGDKPAAARHARCARWLSPQDGALPALQHHLEPHLSADDLTSDEAVALLRRLEAASDPAGELGEWLHTGKL
jgi:hypothetical protein